MSNLVGYYRVSTDRQAEEGFGLDVQRAQVEGWCERHGHTLVATFSDEGISGAKDVEDRPGLAAALAAAESVEGLVVAKQDRLARALTVQEAILAQVWKTGGHVYCSDTGEILRDDPDDPMRTAMRQMAGVFAELERAMIAARLRAGRRMKASKGGYAYGAPPLGTRAEDRELVADPEEQRTLARIVELHSEGQSLRAICRVLTAEGYRPRRADRWHPEVVRKVVARLTQDSPAEAA